jgi:hypothetical protein
MTKLTPEQVVRAKYPDAELVGWPDGAYAVYSRIARQSREMAFTGYIGWGQEKYNVNSFQAAKEAWQDAASRITQDSATQPATEKW